MCHGLLQIHKSVFFHPYSLHKNKKTKTMRSRVNLIHLVVVCMLCTNIHERTEACRTLEFIPPTHGHALVNHVIANISLDREDACRVACFLNNDCFSYNFIRLVQDGHYVCQLSDSDAKQHPGDFKKIDGSIYMGTENDCISYSCPPHGKCAINPTNNSYYCKCLGGYIGKRCDKLGVYVHCSKAPRETGVYDMRLNDGDGKFPVYCDQTSDGGGWAMVFKLVTGATPAYAYELWSSSDTHSENVTAALNINTTHFGHYKNRIVLNEHWNVFTPKQVRVVLYKDGEEVRSLTFNTTRANNINWFSQEHLHSSTWGDLPYKTKFRVFKMEGTKKRSFEIFAEYKGCKKDVGWLVVTTDHDPVTVCPWEKRRDPLHILYSKEETATKFNDSNTIGLADVFAVFVR